MLISLNIVAVIVVVTMSISILALMGNGWTLHRGSQISTQIEQLGMKLHYFVSLKLHLKINTKKIDEKRGGNLKTRFVTLQSLQSTPDLPFKS